MSQAHTWNENCNCGIEVTGLSLDAVTDSQLAEVKEKFAKHGVVYFRNIDCNGRFSEEEHLKFAKKHLLSYRDVYKSL